MSDTSGLNDLRLNGIAPYFTMFPLQFPLDVLAREATSEDVVLDPFCGRGTTNFAARILGVPTYGIDSSPVAVAIAEAKMVQTHPSEILKTYDDITIEGPPPRQVPTGAFWEWAYHPAVLYRLCQIREALLSDASAQAHKALRGLILGALHGPRPKTRDSYFSNQSPRTYAPKPAYAVRYWRARDLKPPVVSVRDIIEDRAKRFYQTGWASVAGGIFLGDSRQATPFERITSPVTWTITSPPYLGMRTYIPDQWLRLWFLGGPAAVSYVDDRQLHHRGVANFAAELASVWQNVAAVSARDAKLLIRFGGIGQLNISPKEVIFQSLVDSAWTVFKVNSAGFASQGRRQKQQFKRGDSQGMEEWDIWAVRHS